MTGQEQEVTEIGNPSTISTEFSRSIHLEIDLIESSLLSPENQRNEIEEKSFPRQVISEAIRSFHLLAEMGRPISIGTYNTLPGAFQLPPRFSFQGHTKNWLTRIQYTEITIIFEDAPEDASSQSSSPPPVIAAAAFCSKPYEGPVKTATVTNSSEFSLQGPSVSGIVGVQGSVGISSTQIQEGKLVIQGTISGRNRNKIIWSIDENHVSSEGIPRSIELPLIVIPASTHRFSAKFTVNAHYGFWRGALAKSVPVLGKNDDPLFFDPTVLRDMAEKKSRGKDETIIVEEAGVLEAGVLEQMAIASFT